MMRMPSCLNANLANAPATTREMVSRADERPPPRWSRILVPYDKSDRAAGGFTFENAGKEFHFIRFLA